MQAVGAAGPTFEGLWGQEGLCERRTGGSLEHGVRSGQKLRRWGAHCGKWAEEQRWGARGVVGASEEGLA